MVYDLTAELAQNLEVYRKFTESRSSVSYPEKRDVPLVWDLYMDTQRPVGSDLAAGRGAGGPKAPIAFAAQSAGDMPGELPYPPSASRDDGLLGLVNDRLKTQARRYPHPITNEMEVIQ